MKSTLTPHIATGVTRTELKVTFGPSGTRTRHEIVVPGGTRCRKLQGGSAAHWVVEDLSFIADKKSILYSDADIYGIPIPEDSLTDVVPVSRLAPAQGS